MLVVGRLANFGQSILANPLCVVVCCCCVLHFFSKIITKIEGGGEERGPPQERPPQDHPNFRSFFPSPATIFIRSSLSEVFSLNFGGVFEAPGPCNVHVWALVLSCETPAASDAGVAGHDNKPSTSPPKNLHLAPTRLRRNGTCFILPIDPSERAGAVATSCIQMEQRFVDSGLTNPTLAADWKKLERLEE